MSIRNVQQRVNRTINELQDMAGADLYGACMSACDDLLALQEHGARSETYTQSFNAILSALGEQTGHDMPNMHDIIIVRDQAQQQGEAMARENGQDFNHIMMYQRARSMSANPQNLPKQAPPTFNITKPQGEHLNVTVMQDDSVPPDKIEAFHDLVKNRTTIKDECESNAKNVKFIQQQVSSDEIPKLDKLALASSACENMLQLQEHDSKTYSQLAGSMHDILHNVNLPMPKRTPNPLSKRDNLLTFQEQINQQGNIEAQQQGENWDYHKMHVRDYVTKSRLFYEQATPGDNLVIDETLNERVPFYYLLEPAEEHEPAQRKLPDISMVQQSENEMQY